MEKQNVVAIILARGGSKGIPHKNIVPVAGKPLIAYTIQAAKRCPLVDRVIVSSDDEEIAKVAREYGAETPFERPEDLSGDTATPEPLLKLIVESLEQKESYKTDIVVYLQITDLFRPKGIVCEVVKKLLDNENLDSVFAAVKTAKNFWRQKDGKFEKLAADIPYGVSRRLREPLYREDTGIALATRVGFIKQGRRIGDKVDVVANPLEFSFLDIHDPIDLWLAEKCIEKMKEEKIFDLYEL